MTGKNARAEMGVDTAAETDAGDIAIPPGDVALIERYLAYVRTEKRLAARTGALYRIGLYQLARLAVAAGVALPRVHNAHVRQWVNQLRTRHNGRGIALTLSSWRGFYTWLGRTGQGAERITVNPVQDVRAPREGRPLPKALAVDEATYFADYAVTDDDAWLEARDHAITELLYGSGLRVSELVGLDVAASDAALRAGRGWIDLQNADVQVQGKGSKRRTVPVGRTALAALEGWLAVRAQVVPEAGAESALFIGRHGTRLTAQSIWQRLRRRGQLAGMTAPVFPHKLRHSFASHVLQSSSDLRGVQDLLGHANIATTQVYTRLDFQHLFKTYDAAHPRAHGKAASKKRD